MKTKVKRRLSERLRSAADALWDRGLKDEASRLHDEAREAEKARREFERSKS